MDPKVLWGALVVWCLPALIIAQPASQDPRAGLSTEIEENSSIDIAIPSTDRDSVFQALQSAGISLEKKVQKPTPEMAAGIVAQIFHLPQHNAKLLDRLVDVLQSHGRGQRTAAASARSRFFSTAGLQRHLRFHQGIPLPAPEKLQPTLLTSAQRELIRNLAGRIAEKSEVPSAVQKQLREQSESIMEQSSAPELPICDEAKTLRIQKPKRQTLSELDQIAKSLDLRVSTSSQKDSSEEFDMLFLPVSAPSIKTFLSTPSELFGENIQVHVYSTKVGDQFSLLASEGKAACLPFRLRVTDKNIYREYGEDALKNYGDKPDGKGTLHPEIARVKRSFLGGGL
ncbi:MAG: hypothetical protein KDD64_09325 [Bdellovibrionales bacterium]|nr:hypothetical protein [Bdellovibrionales bacterium]